MPLDPKKIPIRASTQEHLAIEDVRDDLVILKDGGCVLVLATTAINFGLLSEKEQDATIYSYAALLNSLTFSIQIVIRSQKKDISGYLRLLEQAEKKETKKEIKEQIRKYKKFVKETVAKNEVLDKKFYLVIPMLAVELGGAKTLTASISRKKKLPFAKEYILEKGKTNLYPKRDHLIKQLGRLGLKARQLTTAELIQLYFEIYNPGSIRPPTLGLAAGYQVPIVQLGQKKVASPQKPVSPPQKTEISKETGPQKNLQAEISHLVNQSTD